MVCAAPRVEPRVWLGDKISEAHLPTLPPHSQAWRRAVHSPR